MAAAPPQQLDWLDSLPQIDPSAHLDFSDAETGGGFGFVRCVRAREANPWGITAGTCCALKVFKPVRDESHVGIVARWRYVEFELDVTERLAKLLPDSVPLFYGKFRLPDGRAGMLTEWLAPCSGLGNRPCTGPNTCGCPRPATAAFPPALDIHGWHMELYKARRPVTPTMAAPLIKNLLHALEELHTTGVAHRDIKPENVMITCRTHLTVKLVDFGFAKWFAQRPPGLEMRTGGQLAHESMVLVNPAAKTDKYHPTDFPVVALASDVPKLDLFATGIITLSFFRGINGVSNCLGLVQDLQSETLKRFLLPLLGPVEKIPSCVTHLIRSEWIKGNTSPTARDTIVEPPCEPSFSAEVVRLARLANDAAEAESEEKGKQTAV